MSQHLLFCLPRWPLLLYSCFFLLRGRVEGDNFRPPALVIVVVSGAALGDGGGGYITALSSSGGGGSGAHSLLVP